jgi:hypothetical protein
MISPSHLCKEEKIMARALTPQDCHIIVNLIAKEISGQDATIQSVNSANFVSVGEQIWSYGKENVYNAIGLVMGRTLVAARPYKAPLWLINSENTGVFTHRMRKISFYDKGALPSGTFNTQLFTNLEDGFDNGENPGAGGIAQSTPSMWEQNQTIPCELNFAGSSVMDFCLTFYEVATRDAFRSEDDFARFWSGAMVEYANQIEQRKEAFNRMTMLNFMAGIYDQQAAGTEAVNLTAAYNAQFGTTYTTAQLQTTYLKDFLAFFVSTFKMYSKRMENRSAKYHITPPKTDAAGNNLFILRHTPRDKQRVLLYEPLFMQAEAQVLPEIFNDQYLDIDRQYEGVMFWQNELEGSKISVTPAVSDFTTGQQTTGNAVALNYVVGLLYDEDALMVDYQLESADTTPIEARKKYRNTWLSIARNAINDFTENAVLFYMAD